MHIPEHEEFVPEWERRVPGPDAKHGQTKVHGSGLFSARSTPLTKASVEYVSRRGQLYERQSSKRRASKRAWYSRNAAREVRKSRARRAKQPREAALEQRRRKERAERLKAHPTWRRLSESGWAALKREYQVSRAQGGEPTTFKLLALKYGVSPRAIQRRSSQDGGWVLRRSYSRA